METARYMTRAEWLANDRVAAMKPRPFPAIVRHINPPGHSAGFIETADGRFWTENAQLGWVEVNADSRGLARALALVAPRETWGDLTIAEEPTGRADVRAVVIIGGDRFSAYGATFAEAAGKLRDWLDTGSRGPEGYRA